MHIYALRLNEQQLAIIDAALQELPFKVVLPVFNEINRQIDEQRISIAGEKQNGNIQRK